MSRLAHDYGELEELLKGRIETLENIINIRLNSWLIEMKPEQDDSIVGFNEAWDVVRDVFKKALLAAHKEPK